MSVTERDHLAAELLPVAMRIARKSSSWRYGDPESAALLGMARGLVTLGPQVRNPRKWVLTAIINHVLNDARPRWVQDPPVSLDYVVTNCWGEEDRKLDLIPCVCADLERVEWWETFAALSSEDREYLLLRFRDGLEQGEIGWLYGHLPAWATKREARAVRRLREILGC